MSGEKVVIFDVYFRIHPVEWHEGIALRFNVLGCKSPSRTPPTTTPSAPPTGSTTSAPAVTATACEYWTPWVSSRQPDKFGEYESAWDLRNMITFCDMKYVTMTECRTTGTHIPFNQAGEDNVVCNNDIKGLVCFAQNQTDGSCLDYEIRVFCDTCEGAGSTTTLAPTPCQPKWLPWINNMKPTTNESYIEHEYITIKEQQQQCSNGHVTRIECETIDGIPHDSVMATGTTCDIFSGYTCRNSENYPVPCEDMKVRYYCDCERKYIHQSLKHIFQKALQKKKIHKFN